MRILGALAAFWIGLHAAAAQDRPEIFPQLGHFGSVVSVAFAPDGSVLASSGGDNAVRLWDVATAREIRTLGQHLDANALDYSPDGRILAMGTLDNKIKLFDPAAGRELRTLSGHAGPVMSVAFSPDGRLLASGSKDLTVKIWDVASGQEVASFGGFARQLTAVSFSPDGKLLAANSDDHVLRLWDVASRRALPSLEGYFVGRFAFSPDGRTIACGSSINTVKIWDVASGREIGTLRGHSDYVLAVAFSPDGALLASMSFDKSVRVWDVSNGNTIARLSDNSTPPYNPLWATSLAFSRVGHMLALGLASGVIKRFDTAAGRELPPLRGHSPGLSEALFSPDGRTVACGSFDGTIKMWDAAAGQELRVLGKHAGLVLGIAFSPDGHVLASASTDGTIKLWDPATGSELRTVRGHTESVGAVAFSPDGTMLASGGDDKTARLWDAASGRQLRVLRAGASVNAVKFSPDGRLLAAATGDMEVNGVNAANAVKLWDVASGKLLQTLKGHQKWVTAVAFSPDGSLVASAGDDGTVRLWDVTSGREVHSFGGFNDRVTSVAFTADGQSLVAGSHDSSIKFWNVASGAEIRTLVARGDEVSSVAFSPDHEKMVTASWHGRARIWNLSSGNEEVSFIAFGDGSSLAIAPEGYYDASEKAEDNLNVRVGGRVFSIAAYRDRFYRPDLVRLSLAGKSLVQLGFAGIGSVKVAPLAEFVDLPPATSDAKIPVRIRIVDGGGGVGLLRLFLNGTAVAQDNVAAASSAPDNRGRVKEYTVQLADGPNVLQAEVYNADNSMHSSSALAKIAATLPPANRANLRAVVVGIQEFKNPDFALTYPVKDARLFGETLAKYSAPLFANVEIKLLTTPAETSRDGLIKALKDMQGRVGADDLFVFYVASHGITDDGEYYLVTSNVASASTEHLKSDAISKEELTALVANIPATKKLMVIDTCHAEALGNALQMGLQTRGLDESTALKILSRAVGTTVLAASTSTQQALEGYQGHGLFTYVVAEGLMGKGDVDTEGFVSTLGLAHYVDREVPDLARIQFNHAQYPTVETSGQAFPLTKVR